MKTWNAYHEAFAKLKESGRIDLPVVSENCTHNAHMYYIKCRDLEDRTNYIQYMRDHGLCCVFHYIPLHSAPAGLKYGVFHGEDVYTTQESERLVRLPMYYGMTEEDRNTVIKETINYFRENS